MLRIEWIVFFFSSRRRHTRCSRDWSSDVCSSDLFERLLALGFEGMLEHAGREQLRLVGGGAAVRILERHYLPLLREAEPALDRAGGLGGDGAAGGRSASADRAAAAVEKGDRHAALPAEPGEP